LLALHLLRNTHSLCALHLPYLALLYFTSTADAATAVRYNESTDALAADGDKRIVLLTKQLTAVARDGDAARKEVATLRHM
jgi:hypothetical protein